jgi:hypothetical protein
MLQGEEIRRTYLFYGQQVLKSYINCSGSKESGQKQAQKSIYCGKHWRKKTADYVSTAIEVSQPKFIAHFFCKASLAGKIKIAASMHFDH